MYRADIQLNVLPEPPVNGPAVGKKALARTKIERLQSVVRAQHATPPLTVDNVTS